MTENKLKDKVVLVFDDFSDVAMCIARNLERTLGCVCLNYNRAQECLWEINRGTRFDLFLVDMGVDLGHFKERVGNLTGYDLGKLVSERYPNVTIISKSAYNQRPDYACVHLVKPIKPERIQEEVKAHLEV
ncbi:MAG: hypothetical protein AABX11_07165 [Nanoarchaeota archaeon]